MTEVSKSLLEAVNGVLAENTPVRKRDALDESHDWKLKHIERVKDYHPTNAPKGLTSAEREALTHHVKGQPWHTDDTAHQKIAAKMGTTPVKVKALLKTGWDKVNTSTDLHELSDIAKKEYAKKAFHDAGERFYKAGSMERTVGHSKSGFKVYSANLRKGNRRLEYAKKAAGIQEGGDPIFLRKREDPDENTKFLAPLIRKLAAGMKRMKNDSRIKGMTPYQVARQLHEEIELAEVAPPGKDAEAWIKANKDRFISKYGEEKGVRVLFGKAWKMFGEESQLDELSKEKMQSYKKKAVAQINKNYRTVRNPNVANDKAWKAWSKMQKRQEGATAADRLLSKRGHVDEGYSIRQRIARLRGKTLALPKGEKARSKANQLMGAAIGSTMDAGAILKATRNAPKGSIADVRGDELRAKAKKILKKADIETRMSLRLQRRKDLNETSEKKIDRYEREALRSLNRAWKRGKSPGEEKDAAKTFRKRNRGLRTLDRRRGVNHKFLDENIANAHQFHLRARIARVKAIIAAKKQGIRAPTIVNNKRGYQGPRKSPSSSSGGADGSD